MVLEYMTTPSQEGWRCVCFTGPPVISANLPSANDIDGGAVLAHPGHSGGIRSVPLELLASRSPGEPFRLAASATRQQRLHRRLLATDAQHDFRIHREVLAQE